MPHPTDDTAGDALVLDREAAAGQWVPGPNAMWQKVGVPFGDASGFTRAHLRQHIADAYKAAGGGVPEHVHQFAESLPNAFTFKKGGAYAGEARRMLREGGKEGAGMAHSGAVRLTDDPKEAGGEDAINAFRDRYGDKGEDHYWAVARDRAGYGWQDAMEHARNSQDPSLQFAASVHDNLPDAKGQRNVVTVNAGQLRVGQQFTHNGKVHRVVEDADGHHVLATDNAEFPLDALDRVPLDKGTLKTTKAHKPHADDVAPFSNADDGQWLLNPGLQLSAAAGSPTEHLGQPVLELWGDALVCGDYAHPSTGQRFSFDRAKLDRAAASLSRMIADGNQVPIVADHQERADKSLGWIVGVKRDGDTLKLRHRFIGADAIQMASRNLVSVKYRPSFRDAKGRVYPDAITHSSLTPVPVIPNQQGFSIAASRSPAANLADASSAPVFLLAAPSHERSKPMPLSAELLQRTRSLPGAPKIADDADADFVLSYVLDYADSAGQHLVTMRDENATLAEEKATLLSRAESAEASALELSRAAAADPYARLDPEALADRADLSLSRIDLAMERGDMPKFIADKVRGWVRKGERPNAILLSRSDAFDARPIDAILSLFDGAKLAPPKGEQSGPQSIELARVTPGENEAGKGEKDKADVSEDRKAELLGMTTLGHACLDQKKGAAAAKGK